jgi:hypothetical protein
MLTQPQVYLSVGGGLAVLLLIITVVLIFLPEKAKPAPKKEIATNVICLNQYYVSKERYLIPFVTCVDKRMPLLAYRKFACDGVFTLRAVADSPDMVGKVNNVGLVAYTLDCWCNGADIQGAPMFELNTGLLKRVK